MDKKYGELFNYDVIFEGILKKSPPQKPKAFFTFITKRWRKRHFVLYRSSRPTQIHLVYFKCDPSSESKNIGFINLVKLTSLTIDVGSTMNKSNVFSIHTFDNKDENRIYYLCASSIELMNIWVDKIVTCLNLNNQDKRATNYSTLYSPSIHSPTSGFSQLLSSPKSNTISTSAKHFQESSKFTFSNVNESSHETSSYYNLSPKMSPLFQETVEDPITIDEDVYKVPREGSAAHIYVNIEEEEDTLCSSKTCPPKDVSFQNTVNECNGTNNIQPENIPCSQERNFRFDKAIIEDTDFSKHRNVTSIPNLFSEIKSTDNSVCDFDFALPTRMKCNSLTSSSSSDSTLSTDDHSSNLHSNQIDTEVYTLTNEKGPPLVPKRLNLPESNISLHQKNNILINTVLPIKTPKPVQVRHELEEQYSNFSDDNSIALNYLDAENLFLNNNTKSFHDPLLINVDVSSSDHKGDLKPPFLSELKCTHVSASSEWCNLEESIHSPSVIVDMTPLVEYREICDARTEAILKLNARILKNE